MHCVVRVGTSACVLGAIVLSISCGTVDRDAGVVRGTTTGAGMEILFRPLSPPSSGANQVEVTVKKDGAAVDDAAVTVTFSMPAMPSMNMPEMHSRTTLAPQGDGRYTGTGELSMKGTWNVMIRASRGDAELGTSNLSIIAE